MKKKLQQYQHLKKEDLEKKSKNILSLNGYIKRLLEVII